MNTKFRGYRTDGGGWHYGTYHYSADGKYHYILSLEKFNERPHVNGVKSLDELCLFKTEVSLVHPESVGQWTGRTDQNGVEMYGGDSVDVFDDSEYIGTFTISYNEKLCAFMLKSNNGFTSFLIDTSYEYTVTGNTFEAKNTAV